jgi:hypothetical protein
MANKKSAFILLTVLIFCLSLSAQSQNIQIEDIYLIKNRLDPSPQPPAQIRIGLEVAQNAFFKLFREGNVIQVGLFPRGFNSVSLPAPPLLEKSGKHTYALELKTETGLVRHEIVLDVRLYWEETKEEKNEEEGEEGEEIETPQVKTSEHRISLFFNDELIASRKKILEQQLILPKKESNLPRNYDPFNPDPMDNPFVNSVDIMQAAGLAYQLIKDLVKKKDKGESVPPIQISRQISLSFRSKNPQGIEKQVRATIQLSTRIL